MGDVTADLATRYSIFVPKPLSRINAGTWQVRDGSAQNPKFGYDGVSIQTEKNLFADVTKTTYIQAKGGFTVQTTDWFQCSKNPMVFATGDNAIFGADGVMAIVAGAGQSPTWTLDHGDALDVYPYNNLQLHYRVEEVQNSLFDFFRGRREKDDPFDKDHLKLTLASAAGGAATFALKPELLKREIAMTSHRPWWEISGPKKGAKEAKLDDDDAINAKLRGGFELIAERSWQELFGVNDWDFKKTKKDGTKDVLDKKAPHDIFSGIKDVRLDPDPGKKIAGSGALATTKPANEAVQHDADGGSGDYTQNQLRYGFSAYFSRFDPYLMIDLAAIDEDKKLLPYEKTLMKLVAKLANFATLLKRNTDVLYRLYNVIRDNALGKEFQALVGVVDTINTTIKSLRLIYDLPVKAFAPNRGDLRSQFMDEIQSGDIMHARKWAKTAESYPTDFEGPQIQATVRSCAPSKDPVTQEAKGFYGGGSGGGATGGGFTSFSGTQLAVGDTITITTDVGSYTTPPLTLGSQAATAAKITGSAVDTTKTWSIPSGTLVYVQLDGGGITNVDLSQAPGSVAPTISGALGAGLYGASGSLAGKSLIVSVNGGADTTVTFSPPPADAAAVVATLSAIPGVTVTSTSTSFTLTGATTGPTATIEVKSCSAASALGLAPQKVAGAATVGDVQTYFKNTVGGTVAVSGGAITITSSKTGKSSAINLEENPAGSLKALGLGTTTAAGTDAQNAAQVADITADYLIALFSQGTGWQGKMTFSNEDGAVVIKSPTKGNASSVKISPGTDNMLKALAFVGDNTNMPNDDEVAGYGAHGVGYQNWTGQAFDDLDKMDTELLAMPDDAAATTFRPIIALVRNGIGGMSKLVGGLKAVVKVASLKLPQAKAAIGLIAQKGISLGTPDRIVGVGGQGIVFVADGGTGVPDHAKYVPLEDLFNRITGADLFARYENTPAPKPSLGFRVYSDTTADLVARNTAHVLALGRGKQDGEVVGVGVARVAASYAVEVAGREKIVVRTAPTDDDTDDRIEVVGSTIAVGMFKKVDTADVFGPDDRGSGALGTKGWGDETTQALPETSKVFVHAADQACIAVGEYMVQLRSNASTQQLKKDAQKEVKRATKAKAHAESELAKAQLRKTALELDEAELRAQQQSPMALLVGYHIDQGLQRVQNKLATINIPRLRRNVKKKTDLLEAAQKTLANVPDDEGIIISMRDDAKKSPDYSAKEKKPSLSLSEKKGIQLQTLTDDEDTDGDTNVKLLLNKDGLTIKVGTKAGMVVKHNSVQLTGGTSKVYLSEGKFKSTNDDVDFSQAKKIKLG